jgi:outer membrane usher protein FimD/PapC
MKASICRPNKLALLLATLLGIPLSGYAGTTIDFNTDVLDVKDKANIDVSQFSQAGYMMPGKYTLTVLINKGEIPEQSIDWLVPDNDPKGSAPCVTASLVKQIGLLPKMNSGLQWWHNGQCLDLTSLPGAEAKGDLGTSSLYINIPQAYLEYQAPNWDPPSRWDNGIPGMIFDYYVSGQNRHDKKTGDDHSLSGNGTVGANAGPWRLRADWQGRYDRSANSHTRQSWDWSRYYAFRALPTLGAKLIMGENSLYSDIFDSFRFTGVSLLSDDNMLPPNLRGYAPEVSGVAKTNANVIVSQQGRVIKETKVAAGPFRIQDLNEMVSGELDVRVEEQDGSTQNFKVNTASVPYLTRPGSVRYKLASGRPSDWKHHVNGPVFATGEFSWGINNGWSLYGGGVGETEYKALALGIGRDLLAFGALSLDTTQSRAQLPNENRTLSGGSYRLSYSKNFDETDSQVTFAGYRFSERNYMSMGDFLNARMEGTQSNSNKEMYTVTFSQQIRDWRMSAYLNYSHQTYWNHPETDRYTMTVSRYFNLGKFHDLSISGTAYRNKYNNSDDDGMYLSFSVPWGNNGTVSYNNTISHSDNSHQLSYYGRANDRDNYQISAGHSKSGEMTNGYYTHQGDVALINASADYQEGHYSSLNVSMRGGMTATAVGAALHRSSIAGGTRLMLDTNNIEGIPLRGYGGDTTTNRFGKAVITDVSSYTRTQARIDLDALPDDAEADHSVVQATLTEGAIGYRKFDVISGEKGMVTVRLSDGTYPPFGALVENANHQEVGIINDDGNLYLSGIKAGEHMTVKWGDSAQCELILPPSVPQDLSSGLLLPCEHLTS